MIQIVCALDKNYLQHCIVMLVSLFNNNNNINFHIHIINNDLDIKDENIISQLINKHKHKFSFYSVNENLLSNAPLSHHVSLSTYYRILIPELISPSIEKVLYLDCDIIIRTNIQALWNYNIDNYHIGAAKEFMSKEHIKMLSIPLNYSYFNAGILLMNLKQWRLDNTSILLINYINQNKNKILYWDQDALNAILFNKCFIFSSIWNVTEGFFKYYHSPIEYGVSLKEKLICSSNPNIVHFTGTNKPWIYQIQHPFKKEYLFYQKKTQFKYNKQIGEPSTLGKIKQKLKYLKKIAKNYMNF